MVHNLGIMHKKYTSILHMRNIRADVQCEQIDFYSLQWLIRLDITSAPRCSVNHRGDLSQKQDAVECAAR